MNDFSADIEKQKNTDKRLFSSSIRLINRVFEPKRRTEFNTTEGNNILREMGYIFTSFGMEKPSVPKEVSDDEQMITYLMSVSGMTRRKVDLEKGWYKNASLPLLCEKEDGAHIALLPTVMGNYARVDEKTGKLVKLTNNDIQSICPTAYCFYKPLPNKSMRIRDFIASVCSVLNVGDIVFLITLSAVIALLGLILPLINQIIFNDIIPSGQTNDIFGISAVLIGVTVIFVICLLARSAWLMRIGNKVSVFVQNAVWARIFHLSTDFFSKYQAGEVTERAGAAEELCQILNSSLIPAVLSAVFSLVYLVQIAVITPPLLSISLMVTILLVISVILTTALKLKYFHRKNSASGKLSSFVFQIFSGISRIKANGAEVRAFSEWTKLYSEKERMPCLYLRIADAVNTFIKFGGIIALYFAAYNSSLSASSYIAFYSAFGALAASVMQLYKASDELSQIKPLLDMVKPILQAVPENQTEHSYVSRLNGEIEINQVDFRYSSDMPLVLDKLTLKINPCEYIAVTGASGCGKSTLIRILMAFETPESGAVYYDDKNLERLDKHSLRSRIGVVLQNGKLFAGDIYSNIVIGAPQLTIDDAWEAAEAAGLAEDIRNMPMGMFTMISEGGGGISGGQRQRLLIARAIVTKPDILIFDEATSALDNITQKQVTDTLSKLNCTRIVIAHRLSTITDCDRIIVLNKGKVAEDGTYDELLEKGGLFYDLAKRQRL